MSNVMTTVRDANLAIGRAERKLKLHDAKCAQCQATLALLDENGYSTCGCKDCDAGWWTEHFCDTHHEIWDEILSLKEDIFEMEHKS
jgi:hypothetical protein